MFSTAFNFISNLWTNQEESDGTLTDDVSLKYPATDRKYSIDNSHTIIPSISPNAHKAQRRTEQVSGTITQVFGDYGLIDGDIYFSLSSVLDRECPVVGASVQAVVETTGENELSTKQALSVSIVSNWFDSSDEVKEEMEEVVIGKITKYDKRVGTINEHISFSKDAVPYDFKPYRGDWVKATVVQNIVTGEVSAKAIKPLRDKHFTGEVTHVYPGYGFIDSSIYFPFAACDGFKPQKGDWLTGVAIESDQSRGKWRGTNLYRKSRPIKSETNVEDICQQPQFKWKEELFRNKCGVIITEVTEMLKVSLGGKLQLNLVLKNSLEHEERLVKAVNVSCCAGVTSLKISFSDTFSSLVHPPFTLSPVSYVFTHITFSPRYLGRTVIMTKFQFDDFEIGREIPVDVSDSTLGTFLESSEPVANEPNKGESQMDRWKDNLNKRVNGQVLSYPGVKPTRKYDYNVPVKLPGYPVSRELQSCIMNKGDVRDVRPVLTQPLLMENYSRRFSALLHLEEIQMDIDIRMFDMEMVSMKPWREFLALEVPGLAEGRPSVLVGDKIILSSPEVKSHSLEFDGFVHEVHGEHVLLKFNSAFHESYRAERYNVRFTYSRTSLRRCHQACEFAVNLGVQVLFPASSKSRPPQVDVLLNTQNVCRNSQKQIVKNIVKVSPSPECMTSKIKSYILPFKSGEDRFLVPKVSMATLQEKNLSKSGKTLLKYFNKTLNPRQKAAVVRILQGESRPIPYVLFGPPGTGKTITVVETILQIHKCLSHSRVLACTPSNSAADLLAERLHASGQVTVSDMVRLNAFRRQEEAIPEVISPYCSTGDDLALVARHKIIITTCSTAGSFYQLGLKAGHFTHVFLDEAGQATEPEAMVVIALSGGRDGQSILAGDPCQLGPVLRSKLAKGFGLEMSLLERLMDREAYSRNCKKFRDHGYYDPLLVTKLVDNYRSHPALLKLSSRLFYHGELEPKAETAKVEALCKWNQLPNQEGFPLLFHGIKGKDLKEGNSPSWFNPVEAVQAVKYLQALLADYKQNMTTDDVGIITPYRKQVEKINLLLDSLCIQGVKVGSVEEFQGQERTAIIISTVRSDESLIGFDRLHQLGFVSSPKRFNVAITRPKALLIIVGNPHVLASDSKWRALLQLCSENNAYIGCDLPDLSQYEDEHSDEEEAVERHGEDVSMEIEEKTNPERMVTLDHGAVSTVDQTTVCQEDKARYDDGLVGGSQRSDLSNSQYFPSQKISPGRAISTLQTHLDRGFASSTSDKTLLTLNWSGDKRVLDASQKSTADPKIKDDACSMTNSINVSSHERFQEDDDRDSRNNRTINSENEALISPNNQFEEGNVTLISLRQETPGEFITEDATRRNSSSSLSTRSDTSSRSSSPALNDTRSLQDKKRRRVKPSTSLLNTKLACNFHPKSESEEEKCKSGDRFIKGKGRGLIIKS